MGTQGVAAGDSVLCVYAVLCVLCKRVREFVAECDCLGLGGGEWRAGRSLAVQRCRAL